MYILRSDTMSDAFRKKELEKARNILSERDDYNKGLSAFAENQGLALKDIPSSTEGIGIFNKYKTDYDKSLKQAEEKRRTKAIEAAGGSQISKSVFGSVADSLQAITKAPNAPEEPTKIDYTNAPVMGPLYEPEATPKADAYMAKREAPKFDPNTMIDTDPRNARLAEMGFNRNALAMEREDRTSRRKDFASQLNTANYNPATASSEDKAKFYAMGKDMGLSSDQIDSYANKQLDKQAERDYKRANMGKFLETVDSRRGRSSGVQGSSGLRRQSNSNIKTSQADLDKQEQRNQYRR